MKVAIVETKDARILVVNSNLCFRRVGDSWKNKVQVPLPEVHANLDFSIELTNHAHIPTRNNNSILKSGKFSDPPDQAV